MWPEDKMSTAKLDLLYPPTHSSLNSAFINHSPGRRETL